MLSLFEQYLRSWRLIALSIELLDGDVQDQRRLHPPGTMSNARRILVMRQYDNFEVINESILSLKDIFVL